MKTKRKSLFAMLAAASLLVGCQSSDGKSDVSQSVSVNASESTVQGAAESAVESAAESTEESAAESADDASDRDFVKAVCEANTNSALVEKFGHAAFSSDVHFSDGTVYSDLKYIDKDCFIADSSNSVSYDIGGRVYSVAKKTGNVFINVFIDDHYNKEYAPSVENISTLNIDESERVIEKKEENGVISFVTVMDVGDILSDYFASLGYDPEEFVSYKGIYEVEADGYALLSVSGTAVRGDGSEVLITESVRDDGPAKTIPQDLLELLSREETRTLTLITDTETITQKVPEGVKFLVYPSDSFTLYLDPEFAEAFETDAGEALELTLYLKRG